MFVVEGVLGVRTLLASDWSVHSLLLLKSRLSSLADVTIEAPVYVGSRDVLDQVAGFAVHRGVLALGRRRPEPEPRTLLSRGGPILVVEGVNDHENMGSLFRNAAAFGASAVLLDPSSCDPLYRRAVRVSMGHVLRVPFSRLRPWPGALEVIRTAGIPVVALDPGAGDTIDAVPRHPPTAVLVGAEGPGLSAAARALAAHRVRIPMAPGVDSLNVATAAAIALRHLSCRP